MVPKIAQRISYMKLYAKSSIKILVSKSKNQVLNILLVCLQISRGCKVYGTFKRNQLILGDFNENYFDNEPITQRTFAALILRKQRTYQPCLRKIWYYHFCENYNIYQALLLLRP